MAGRAPTASPVDRLIELMQSSRSKARFSVDRGYLAYALWKGAITPEYICKATGIDQTYDLAQQIKEDAAAVYGEHAKASRRR